MSSREISPTASSGPKWGFCSWSGEVIKLAF